MKERSYVDGNVEGNFYDKHNSKNPIVKLLMRNFHSDINQYIGATRSERVLDVGCGEGYTTKIIKDSNNGISIEGIEYGDKTVEKARKLHPDVQFSEGSIYEIEREAETYDLVLSTEVLEHLEQPEKGLKELKRVSRKCVLVTVPNEPWWRVANLLRLQYIRDLGNTPGHLNHWSKRGLERFLRPHFREVYIKNSILWNVALCVK